MDLEKLRELIGMFETSGLAEIEIEEEGRRVRLTKSAPQPMHAPQLIAHIPSGAPIAMPAPMAQSSGAPVQQVQDTEPDPDEGLVIIESPMVGVFYAQPSPGDPPFVKPGDLIEVNQTVCIVEAMKLMNEVAAKFKCTIVNVLVENGEPVEYNQPLFAVKPVE